MAERDRRARAGSTVARVAVECLNCGRSSTLGDDAAPDDLPLVQLTKRLRCSECGSRAVKAARIETPRDLAKLMRSRMQSRGS